MATPEGARTVIGAIRAGARTFVQTALGAGVTGAALTSRILERFTNLTRAAARELREQVAREIAAIGRRVATSGVTSVIPAITMQRRVQANQFNYRTQGVWQDPASGATATHFVTIRSDTNLSVQEVLQRATAALQAVMEEHATNSPTLAGAARQEPIVTILGAFRQS